MFCKKRSFLHIEFIYLMYFYHKMIYLIKQEECVTFLVLNDSQKKKKFDYDTCDELQSVSRLSVN